MPALRHGVARVDHQIQHRGLELMTVDVRLGQVGLQEHLDLDVFAQRTAQQPLQTVHELIEVDGPGLEGLLAGKGQQALRQVRRLLGCNQDVMQQLGAAGIGLALALLEDLGAAQNHGQQVVEVMGNAAGKLAYRLELLRLAQLLLGLLAPSDVVDDHQACRPAGEVDVAPADLHADRLAAARAMLAFALLGGFVSSGRFLRGPG